MKRGRCGVSPLEEGVPETRLRRHWLRPGGRRSPHCELTAIQRQCPRYTVTGLPATVKSNSGAVECCGLFKHIFNIECGTYRAVAFAKFHGDNGFAGTYVRIVQQALQCFEIGCNGFICDVFVGHYSLLFGIEDAGRAYRSLTRTEHARIRR